MFLVFLEVDLVGMGFCVVQLILLVSLRHVFVERNYRVLRGLERSLVFSYQQTQGIPLTLLVGVVAMATNPKTSEKYSKYTPSNYMKDIKNTKRYKK